MPRGRRRLRRLGNRRVLRSGLPGRLSLAGPAAGPVPARRAAVPKPSRRGSSGRGPVAPASPPPSARRHQHPGAARVPAGTARARRLRHDDLLGRGIRPARHASARCRRRADGTRQPTRTVRRWAAPPPWRTQVSATLPPPEAEGNAPVRRFAFNGRVSTEDNQDPEASRNWQLSRSRALIEPAGGIIVAEYFDIGQSRSLPWPRRPQAAQLLADLADPSRGFDAVVIGEPQRAFYGNQYSLTMPVLTHYGVQLWVPEVGGPIDPDSEAHDLIMSVFGGMSKGERNRIKLRVRAAMAAQAAVEGRF